MSGAPGITLAELVSSLGAAGKTMPLEVGAFLTLEAVERALDAPSTLALDTVRILDDGVVQVTPATLVPDEADTTARAAGLLGRALLGAGSAPSGSLLGLVEQGPSDGSARLGSFRDELESCLLPLNRGASRRILSRLVREARLGGPSAEEALEPAALDARLDAWLAGELGAPAGLMQSEQEPPLPLPERAAPAGGLPAATRAPLELDEGLTEAPRSPRRAGKALAALCALAAAAGGAYAVHHYGLLSRLAAPSAPAPAVPAPEPLPAADAPYGDLTVHTADRAQIFLRVGRGPAVATNLPLGIAHEFVAIDEAHAPARAVVPKDARWAPTERGPRIDLTIGLGPTPTPFAAMELGPTELPREAGSHRGEVGAVRVLTEPPGAEVYLLIGFGPDVSVRDLRADQAYELLVYAPEHVPVRVPLEQADFVEGADGALRATLDVNLERR